MNILSFIEGGDKDGQIKFLLAMACNRQKTENIAGFLHSPPGFFIIESAFKAIIGLESIRGRNKGILRLFPRIQNDRDSPPTRFEECIKFLSQIENCLSIGEGEKRGEEKNGTCGT